MAVIVKYVVERNGEEKMTFTSKAEADAYDKMLDMADELFSLLGESKLIEDEEKQEEPFTCLGSSIPSTVRIAIVFRVLRYR